MAAVNRTWGAAAGLLAGAVALGVAELTAAALPISGGPLGAPVVAVGEAAINLTPVPVKEFAIAHFGTHDKQALIAGILALLAAFAAVTGLLAVRRLGFGLAGLAAFAAVGVAAGISRPGAGAAEVLPTLAGAAAGAGTLVLLIRMGRTSRAAAGAVLDAARLRRAGTGQTESRIDVPRPLAQVKAAGLVDTLISASNITVFAPGNAAFARSACDPDELLANKAELTTIRTYHVAPARYTPVQLSSGTAIKTLEGGMVTPAAISSTCEVTNGQRGLRERPDRQRHHLPHRHRTDAPRLLGNVGQASSTSGPG